MITYAPLNVSFLYITLAPLSFFHTLLSLFNKASGQFRFGTTCDGLGTVYFVNATTPFFGCPDVVPATTTTVSTTTNNAPVVQPCNCAYTDDGARLNLVSALWLSADLVLENNQSALQK